MVHTPHRKGGNSWARTWELSFVYKNMAKPKSGNFGIGPVGVLAGRLHHPVHRRVLPVLDLSPVLRPTSLIGPVSPFFRCPVFSRADIRQCDRQVRFGPRGDMDDLTTVSRLARQES
jgi:hypothetical protein